MIQKYWFKIILLLLLIFISFFSSSHFSFHRPNFIHANICLRGYKFDVFRHFIISPTASLRLRLNLILFITNFYHININIIFNCVLTVLLLYYSDSINILRCFIFINIYFGFGFRKLMMDNIKMKSKPGRYRQNVGINKFYIFSSY